MYLQWKMCCSKRKVAEVKLIDKRKRLTCLTFFLSSNVQVKRSKNNDPTMTPLLTWLRMSYGQTSVLSSCTVSGVTFYSSTPVEISLFLDTHTPQTSSSIWLSPQCLGLDLWTLPWSTGPGFNDKKNSTPRKMWKL